MSKSFTKFAEEIKSTDEFKKAKEIAERKFEIQYFKKVHGQIWKRYINWCKYGGDLKEDFETEILDSLFEIDCLEYELNNLLNEEEFNE